MLLTLPDLYDILTMTVSYVRTSRVGRAAISAVGPRLECPVLTACCTFLAGSDEHLAMTNGDTLATERGRQPDGDDGGSGRTPPAAFASLLGSDVAYRGKSPDLSSDTTGSPDARTPPPPAPPLADDGKGAARDVPDSASPDTTASIANGDVVKFENGFSSCFEMDSSALQRLQSLAQSENNNSQILNTADVSSRIREILSTNNIGQRLFAKHVLGLSQGTVSELLSKPKHWDKLTEKGRESYRKMYAWSMEETNVAELKAISPKKGNCGRFHSIVSVVSK